MPITFLHRQPGFYPGCPVDSEGRSSLLARLATEFRIDLFYKSADRDVSPQNLSDRKAAEDLVINRKASLACVVEISFLRLRFAKRLANSARRRSGAISEISPAS